MIFLPFELLPDLGSNHVYCIDVRPTHYPFLPGGLLNGLIDLTSRVIRHLHDIGRKSLFKPDLRNRH
jgi:hypothetical protein